MSERPLPSILQTTALSEEARADPDAPNYVGDEAFSESQPLAEAAIKRIDPG